SRPATAAKSGVFDFVDDVFARQSQCSLQLFVTAIAEVTLDVVCPAGAANVFVNEAVFQRMRRPRQFQITDCRLPIAEKIRSGIWIDTLAQLVANHAHWCGVTAGKTFNKFDAVSSVVAHRDRVMRFFTIARTLDSQTRAQVFHQCQSPRHRTTERATDPDMRLPGRMLAKHWIKRDHFENVDRLQAELFRVPENGVVVDETDV